MFACERFGLVPDILDQREVAGRRITSWPPSPAKPTSWMPLVPEDWAGPSPAIPLPALPGLAVINVIEKQKLCERAEHLGEHFKQRARAWQRRWPIIGDVRGLGGMCAIELVQPGTRQPAADETSKITRYCYEHGVVSLSTGSFSNVIRVLMPLVITDEQFDEALDVLEAAITSVVVANTEQTQAVHS